MSNPATGPAARRLYDDAMQRALRVAGRHVAWDQALEVAHDVASALVAHQAAGPNDPTDSRSFDALIHRSVKHRLHNLRRSARRRSAAEQVHHDERSDMAPSWAGPDARLETRELVRVVDATIADMPDAMRQIYLLVRQDDHSYRDAAAALGIGVGTVHTQLSRANALLRKAINDYRAASPTIETAPPDEESPSVSRAQ